MAVDQMHNVLDHLRQTLTTCRETGATDGELLDRFVVCQDEAAFELLVWRHHRLVQGVCSRILADIHDVEDAFQATFLVLARRGRSIRKRGSLSSWLFGVARRVALEARRGKERRPSRALLPSAAGEPGEELMRRELQDIVDEELGQLPEKYRAPVVLCYLEGITYEEAGQRLGCSKGTISTRLTRARELLRARLAGRGLALTAGSLAAWLCASAATAGAPGSLVAPALRAATSLAAGKAAGVGMISPRVAALTEGVLKAMMMRKLKAPGAVALVLGLLLSGAAILTCRTTAAPGDAPTAGGGPVKTPPIRQDRMEAFTAWGEEVGGVQAGLGFLPGQHRAYHTGETVKLVVRVRNLGRKEVKLAYFHEDFTEHPPTATDGEGRTIRIEGAVLLGKPSLVEVRVEPGKEIALCELNLALLPAGEQDRSRAWTLCGTGKFQLQYEQIGGHIRTRNFQHDPILSKLATAKLELEVKPSTPPATEPKTKPPDSPADRKTPDAAPRPTAATEQARFEGTWVLVSSERDGQAKSEEKNPYTLTFTGNRWKVHRGDDVAVQGTLKLVDIAATPRKFNLVKTVRFAPGTSVDYGIYEWKGDTLRYCTRNGPVGAGIDTPDLRPRDFMTRDGDGRTLYVWKRAQP